MQAPTSEADGRECLRRPHLPPVAPTRMSFPTPMRRMPDVRDE